MGEYIWRDLFLLDGYNLLLTMVNLLETIYTIQTKYLRTSSVYMSHYYINSESHHITLHTSVVSLHVLYMKKTFVSVSHLIMTPLPNACLT